MFHFPQTNILNVKRLFRNLLVLLALFDATTPYSILLVPLFVKSHVMSMFHLGEALVQLGHEVVILLPENFKLPPQLAANTSGIGVERYGEGMRDKLGSIDYDAVTENMIQELLNNQMINVLEMFNNLRQMFEMEQMRHALELFNIPTNA